MSKEVRIALLGMIGSVLSAILPKLLEKPFDIGMTIVLVVLIGSITVMVIYILREPLESSPGSYIHTFSKSTEELSTSKETERKQSKLTEATVRGFYLAVAAALCWSIGNVLLRLTAFKLPASSFDIAMLNYIVAAIALIIIGFILCYVKKQPFRFPRIENPGNFLFVAFAKGLNTYSWILAVTLISAMSAATLEGLHVVFTLAILFLVLKIKAPIKSWVTLSAGTVLLIVGAFLILGVPTVMSNAATLGGIGLGLISGLSFSVFYVFWVRNGQRPSELWQRVVEMGGLLLVSLLWQFPIHVLVNALWLKGSLVPFAGMSQSDMATQALCGLIGIGATYLLINESLHLMRSNKLCSLLLGVGLSYSVPFTMILESWFLDYSTTFIQWMGALVFAAAFAAIYQYIRDPTLEN